MSDKPRRAWLRIHLSTAVVLMFVAGGLIGLNLKGKYELGERFGYGWPCRWISIARYETFSDVYRIIVAPARGDWLPDFSNLIINVMLFVAILICVAIISELSIRHREARAP